MQHLLSIVIFTPAVAALILALVLRGGSPEADRNAKWVALTATSVTFLISLFLLAGFDPSNTGFQFMEKYSWIMGFQYRVGVDGLSILFVMLTTFMMPLVIIGSWNVTDRVKEYMIAFLVLETLMVGTFVTLDLVLFYLFFEAGLIPMFLIIGIWGGKQRVYAAFKFFLYTFFGSVFMLVSIIYIYFHTGTTDMPGLLVYEFPYTPVDVLGISIPGGVQTLLWIGFFISFAIKMPLWPVHTWLPAAHVQAPTAGSVVLAAILLKLADYGFLRFSLPMFPVGNIVVGPWAMWLAVIAIIWTSLVALVQTDIKRVIAYSSVAHMAYVLLGIFSGTQQGIEGGIFLVVSHGFVSGALFLLVGVIYERMHTREIDAYGGLVKRMPAYATIFMFFTMANVGLPGTGNFVGEFLTLAGTFQVNTWAAMFATSGVILSAAYALWLYRRVVFGDLIKESLRSITDLTTREKWIFAPLVAMTLILGVYPDLVTNIIGPSVTQLVQNYHDALPDTYLSDLVEH
ncbi:MULTISPECIES: NADH-quinone oxidoreductase subunit M [Thioclava]|uniref:NADH-quinone oxidoreductase subunit M n=1 Tax=Thioclava nitratireducens TaxID=1915078 RepID=A0ABM6IGF5_9RHOB|nr:MULTISPECIES: NADH-quinone oxidoreductase subunit M [Thioclava]AQS47809.1 NADH-quinone oxidoreductase subunit M [Thioclava nitratireducens]OWY05453.1 NADH-quinone oxidoreductase subunit M [Thioclava sp. F1Mire-8]OWY07134.1 NADH-quinone oxidoreductase subunit M [Thioclava sp. IC9]OWY10741.1 NADH-quinone oxidoreductase subunit M [Thioclava sp. F42-5]OWY12723.1 NADH-quinone oxidoreductase subunit M [Thioclava sp. F34-6]